MGHSYRSEKGRRPRNYDLFGLYQYYLPGLGSGWLLTAASLALQFSVGVVFAIPYQYGFYQIDSYALLSYVGSFAVLLMICSLVSRLNAVHAEYGIALSGLHFGRTHALLMIPLAMAGILGLVVAMDPLTSLVQRYVPDGGAIRAMNELILAGNPWLTFLNVAVCAPLFEELFVRGILLRGMLSHLRPGWAIFWSALMFGVMHGNLVQGLFAVPMGMLLGYAYYKTGCLWLTMLMHFANNATSFLLLKLAPSADEMAGLVPTGSYVIMIVAGLLLALLFLRTLKRIPLEQKRGNLDLVPVDNLL